MHVKEERVKKRYIRKRKRSAAPIFGMWLFLLFCCFLAAYGFMNSAFFSVKGLEVEGNTVLTAEEIIQLSELAPGTNIMKVQTADAVSRLELHPSIKRAAIKRKLPNSLIINIIERSPLALVVGQGGFIAVDEEGYYIKKINDLQDNKMPIISSVSVDDNVRPGQRLETSGLTAAINLIKLVKTEFLVHIAEVIAPSQYSLTLKTVSGVEVRFGEPVDIERKIQIMEKLLFENGASINSQTVEYIDLRYNTAPVIKRK